VLSALPDAIVITTSDGPDAARMRRLIAAIKDEIESARAGVGAIATDLASALFVMVVRVHLEREHAGNGLLGLLAHRQAGRAVVAMLEDLGRTWTLDALAERANASRASLVRMFQKLAHRPPLEFLSELRLELARRKLAATALPLGDIAAQVGYQSESAFSRAFRRRFGFPPGEARTSAAAHPHRAAGPSPQANRFVARPALGRHRPADTSFRGTVSFGA
jgi:AraC family transcriptional activator of mtrCDE